MTWRWMPPEGRSVCPGECIDACERQEAWGEGAFTSWQADSDRRLRTRGTGRPLVAADPTAGCHGREVLLFPGARLRHAFLGVCRQEGYRDGLSPLYGRGTGAAVLVEDRARRVDTHPLLSRVEREGRGPRPRGSLPEDWRRRPSALTASHSSSTPPAPPRPQGVRVTGRNLTPTSSHPALLRPGESRRRGLAAAIT